MTKSEILKVITEWERLQKQIDAQLDRVYDLVGCKPDSPLLGAIYKIAEAHTDAVSQIVGDEDKWLYWWQFETDYGHKQMSAAMANSKLRPIKTLKQLAGMIAE